MPEGVTVLLYVAALQPEKHPVTAVRALSYLPDSTWLLMVGDGPQRTEVETVALRLAPGRVVLTGQVADMARIYWAADVFVLPSEGEGLPAVLIEAGLTGLPAVASTSGGCEDIVIDHKSGRIVPPADEAALAGAVREVVDARESMGESARQRCSAHYDLPVVTAQWAAILDDVSAHVARAEAP